MNVKRLAIGAVVGGIVLYVVGYIFFDLLFLDYYEANAGAAGVGMRETQVLWAMIVGVLLYGALVTVVATPKAGSPTIGGGITMGALAGLLLWGTADFTLYGYIDLWNLNVTILDIVLETIRGAVTGAVVALVLAKLPN